MYYSYGSVAKPNKHVWLAHFVHFIVGVDNVTTKTSCMHNEAI